MCLQCKSLSISLSLSCIFGDQLNMGNSVWLSWTTKAGVIILTVLPHSPLSLAEKSCKSWHLQSLVWQPFRSNPGIQQNTKIVWQTKSQKNSPRMLFFLTISPNRGVVTRFKHEYLQPTLSQCQLQCKVVQMVSEVNRMTNHNGRSALLRSVLCNNIGLANLKFFHFDFPTKTIFSS